MRIEIRGGYDGQCVMIDSCDLETLARWLIETIERVKPTHVFPAMVTAWPSAVPDGKPDWIADARVIGEPTAAKTPREIAAAFVKTVERWEELTGKPV